MKRTSILFLLILSITFTLRSYHLFAQEIGFMGINIGMTRVQALQAAELKPMIEVPRNRDVELFPVEDRKILTLSVKPEVPFIYLQFFNDKLYAITVIFDEKYVDYFSLCDALQEKYGMYAALKPSWRQWQLEGVIIKVEKPAVVKYIALEEFLRETNFKARAAEEEGERRALLLEGL